MISFDELKIQSVAIFNVIALPLVQASGYTVSYEPAPRGDNMLYYMIQGERSYMRDGESILEVHPNDILFLPSDSRYTSIVTSKEENKGFFVRFHLMDCEGKPVCLGEEPRILLSDPAGSLLSSFKELTNFSLQTMGTLQLSALIYQLIDSLIDMRHKCEFSQKHIEPALKYMRTHLRKPVSISLLADLCHMSERTFCRHFEAETGQAPITYHRRLRILKAKEILESGLYTVEQTADVLGFEDTAHFSRSFFKVMGFSAGSVRKGTKHPSQSNSNE